MDERTANRTADGNVSGAADSWPLSAREAAAVLGVSERTIRRAITRGDLAASKRGGVYRIAPADLDRYRARGRITALAPPRPMLPPRLIPFPGRESATAMAMAFPRPRTSLIGRERELDAVADLLRGDGGRLVTLVGPGGVGKTRLALHAAEQAATDFPEGVWFVELAPIRDPALVASTILRALGVAARSDRPAIEALIAAIRDRRLLLVLDNYEHLLSAAPLVSEVLATCPRLVVLVTSRARLNLTGERAFVVPPLSVSEVWGVGSEQDEAAPPRSEAVALFVERAHAVHAPFRLTAENVPTIAAICAEVDGLPLAIELAAAQTRFLSPAALLARLGRRLPLLTGGPRDQPARLRTMTNAIAWSHDLLSEVEQTLFRRLAVFVGGLTLEAAEWVMDGEADVINGVASLVDHQLLGRVEQADGEPRLTMLETIREFGRERLAASGEDEAIGARHAAFYVGLAVRAEPALIGPDQVTWLEALESELFNLRAALAWLRDAGEAERGLRLAAALWTFWVVRDRVPEGRHWLETFLAAAPAESAGRAKALVAVGDMAERQGDYAAAAAWLDEAAVLARVQGLPVTEAAALRTLGAVATSQGEIARDRLNDGERAESEFTRAEALLQRSLSISRDAGDAWGVAKAKHWLAILPLERGDRARAVAELEDALADFRRLGDHRQVCMALGNIGSVIVGGAGQTGRGRDALVESLLLARRLGYRWWIGWCLDEFAQLAIRVEEGERAARLIGAATALRPATGEPLRSGPQRAQEQLIATIQAALGVAPTEAALRVGAALPLDEAITEALAVGEPAPPPQAAGDTESSPPAGVLTARELDILRLLVEGRSNAEIAEALFVGVRTVRAHVANILAKLGAPTRTAAATHALRRGLV